MRLVFALGVALVAAAGCALFSEGLPENVCRGDGDCFQAQGEVCDLEARKCVPGNGIPADAADAASDGGDAGDAGDATLDAPGDAGDAGM